MGGKQTSLAAKPDPLNFATPTTSSSPLSSKPSPSSSPPPLSVDSVFGSVPTRLEAEYAITAFQRYETNFDLLSCAF